MQRQSAFDQEVFQLGLGPWSENRFLKSVYQLHPDVYEPSRRYCRFYKRGFDFKLESFGPVTCCQSHHWWQWKKRCLCKAFFSPYCSCQGAFEIPFLMRAGIPPSFSISSGGEAGRVSDRGMTAAKVPQSGKVFCSQLVQKSYLALRFVFL